MFKIPQVVVVVNDSLVVKVNDTPVVNDTLVVESLMHNFPIFIILLVFRLAFFGGGGTHHEHLGPNAISNVTPQP
jgi:hypothetical protein